MILTLGDQQQDDTPTRTPHPAPPRQDYMGRSLCKEHNNGCGHPLKEGRVRSGRLRRPEE